MITLFTQQDGTKVRFRFDSTVRVMLTEVRYLYRRLRKHNDRSASRHMVIMLLMIGRCADRYEIPAAS